MAVRRKKASTPTRRPSFDAAGKVVALFGESPLVEEFAVRCLSKGFEVQIRFNPSTAGRGGKNGALVPKGAKSVSRPDPAAFIAVELTNLNEEAKRRNLADLDRSLKPKTAILSSSTTVSVAEQLEWVGRPARLIGIGALPTLLEGSLVEFAPSPLTDEATLVAAREFAGALEKEAALVQDSVGLVLPRILCMLTNEAAFALMEGVAGGADIDTAMKLGTNYPRGPIEWAERIGPRHVLAVVTALHRHFGEERYRVAPLLRRAARYGSFTSHTRTPEGRAS